MIAELYNRIRSKIERDIAYQSINKTPAQKETTFVNRDNLYYPVFAGPSSFESSLTSPDTIKGVIDILKKLDSDKYVKFNIEYLSKGLENFGNQWRCLLHMHSEFVVVERR